MGLRKYLASVAGNTSVMLGLAALPLLGGAGLAVDYVNRYSAVTELQSALDGAVLAGASAIDASDSQRIAVAKAYFLKASKGTAFEGRDPVITIASGALTGSYEGSMDTTLMAALGTKQMSLGGMAEVSISNEGKIEVAMVLDYSGSMNSNGKYQAMRDAATFMIDNLATEYRGNNLKIGLAPFSAMVRATLPASHVAGASGGSWTGCTQDRAHPYNITLDLPTTDDATKWGYVDPGFENSAPYDCTTYANNNLDVVPLTSDISTLKSKLASMLPVGNTNIPLGAQFGWMLLDSAEPFSEGAPTGTPSTGKFLILLTDGVQTSSQFDKHQVRSVAAGEDNLKDICKAVRKDGITVYAIAYDITDPKVTGLLKSCAPGNYYEPDAGNGEIKAVFADITAKIKNEYSRLTK